MCSIYICNTHSTHVIHLKTPHMYYKCGTIDLVVVILVVTDTFNAYLLFQPRDLT